MTREYRTPEIKPAPARLAHVTAQRLHGKPIIEIRTGHHLRQHLTPEQAANLVSDLNAALGIVAADGTVEPELPTTLAEAE